LRMLLVDSGRRALAEATEGEPSQALDAADTLAMPLRTQDEYSAAPERYLTWLRRRWFCRIPRSHCTEGLRPLGRLALVDHGQELIAQLKTAVTTMISAEAIAASTQSIGREMAPSPEVILVASISGGAGGGMLLDAAYAVRKVLADLSLSHARLTGVLLHSTGRSPHDKLLARANTCACLRELQHFGSRGYPGDADLGLPAFDGIPPFDATRIVHLGDGLNEEEFHQAVENVGQYLDLATATSGGLLFGADQAEEESEMTVRTFGMSPIGRAQIVDSLASNEGSELLPNETGQSLVASGLLKSCLESAAPLLTACGGSRRLWLIGEDDGVRATLRAEIERETAQSPSVAVDSQGDFVVGWEVEGLSLARVAACLMDSQPDIAQLALRLHTRLDIAW